MSKAKLLLDLAESMHALADVIIAVSKEADVDTTVKDKPEKPEEKQPTVSLEKVRGILADKSRQGFTAEVREIIKRYGADKLSGVAPEHYADILKEAEVLENG